MENKIIQQRMQGLWIFDSIFTLDPRETHKSFILDFKPLLSVQRERMSSGTILKEKESPPHPKVLGSAHLDLSVVRASATPPPSSEVLKAAKFEVKRGWKHFLSPYLGQSVASFRSRFSQWTSRKPQLSTPGNRKPQRKR